MPTPDPNHPDWGLHYLPRELAALCWGVGFRDLNLIKSVAVILGESNGYDRRTGVITPKDTGLFQINLDAHPQYTQAQLFDAVTNVHAGYSIFKDSGYVWDPWVAYTAHLVKVFNKAPDAEDQYKAIVRYATMGVANFWNERFGLPLA